MFLLISERVCGAPELKSGATPQTDTALVVTGADLIVFALDVKLLECFPHILFNCQKNVQYVFQLSSEKPDVESGERSGGGGVGGNK